MKTWLLKSRKARVIAGSYLLLWLLTMTIGTAQVDHRFDREFRVGYPSFSDKSVPIERIDKFYVRDLMDSRNAQLIPSNGLFRYRSRGLAVAPFVIVDEVGTVFGGLAGLGALRINLWFFGYTKWWIAKGYWAV